MRENNIGWYDSSDSRCYAGGKDAVMSYNEACLSRREQHPLIENKYQHIADELEEKGYCVLKNAFDRDRVLKFHEETTALMSDTKNLKFNDAYLQMVDQPMLKSRSALEFAFDDLIVDIASSYFQCIPALGTVNLKRSLINELPPTETLLFHCDTNCVKFLKFFIYLNDVDMDGGPFAYVEGSHKKKFEYWESKYRWPDNEIEFFYGADSIKHLTAATGDLVIANTTGFHKGTKVKNSERLMYTINYVIHPEYWKPVSFGIKNSDYDSLSENKKPAADFLLRN